MTGWVILVDQARDLPNAETPHKVISTSEYLARPRLFDMARPKIVNLARSYAYQSKGYYASLLAEARGHRVVPTVETMLELREAKLYEHALPELEDLLNRCALARAQVRVFLLDVTPCLGTDQRIVQILSSSHLGHIVALIANHLFRRERAGWRFAL